MHLSMAFYIANDSTEVMKSLNQGRALNNLPEVAFLNIALTMADLFIACMAFYLISMPTLLFGGPRVYHLCVSQDLPLQLEH
jgi:hypothetical protein